MYERRLLWNRVDIQSLNLSKFEAQVLSELKKARLKRVRLLLAISGGRDSVALLASISRIAPLLKLELIIAYCHHGESAIRGISNFREDCLHLVEKLARLQKWKFVSARHEGAELRTEGEFRHFRRHALERMASELKCHSILTAHHRDDLIETRLMRLIRGVGPQGLKAMELRTGLWVRPFLRFSRQQISDFAADQKLKWMEDPSNQNDRYLRNWIRNRWLPQLEAKQAGAVSAFARSLDVLSGLTDETPLREVYTDGSIDLVRLAELSFRDQRRVIAGYLREQNVANYSLSHIDEIIKRLESRDSRGEFRLLKRNWECDAGRLRVLPPSSCV